MSCLQERVLENPDNFRVREGQGCLPALQERGRRTAVGSLFCRDLKEKLVTVQDAPQWKQARALMISSSPKRARKCNLCVRSLKTSFQKRALALLRRT